MVMTAKQLPALTAEDVMSRGFVTLGRQTSLREAAGLLRRAGVCGAEVVDEQGRCVGMLWAADFLRWAADGCPDAVVGPALACPHQVQGRLLTGEESVICTLAEGSCPLQVMRPTTAGGHTAVCLQPQGVLSDWQQVTEDLPAGGAVCRYMSPDVVTAGPQTPLPELARRMIDAHSHRVVITEEGKPVGIVSALDVLAAVARDEAGLAGHPERWPPLRGPGPGRGDTHCVEGGLR